MLLYYDYIIKKSNYIILLILFYYIITLRLYYYINILLWLYYVCFMIIYFVHTSKQYGGREILKPLFSNIVAVEQYGRLFRYLFLQYCIAYMKWVHNPSARQLFYSYSAGSNTTPYTIIHYYITIILLYYSYIMTILCLYFDYIFCPHSPVIWDPARNP